MHDNVLMGMINQYVNVSTNIRPTCRRCISTFREPKSKAALSVGRSRGCAIWAAPKQSSIRGTA